MKSKISVQIVLCLFLLISSAKGDLLDDVYEDLASSDEIRESHRRNDKAALRGAICEQIVKSSYQSIYPTSEYWVESNVVVSEEKPKEPRFLVTGNQPFRFVRNPHFTEAKNAEKVRRVVGELDIVVIRKNDNNVVLVAESKCWRDLNEAFEKANSQREVFLKILGMGTDLQFSKGLNKNQFSDPFHFVLIAQRGGLQYGFDQEFGFDLQDIKTLEGMLDSQLGKKRRFH